MSSFERGLRPSSLLLSSFVALALASPGVARAQQPQPAVVSAEAAAPTAVVAATPAAPPGEEDALIVRYPPTSARWRILVAGLGITAVGYGASALMGGLWEGIPGGDMLYIPVAGPWIALGQSGCAPTEESTPGEGDCEAMIGLRAAVFVVDGLLQLGGLALVAESIFMTTESDGPAPPAKAAVVPIVTPTMVGLGVGGTF